MPGPPPSGRPRQRNKAVPIGAVLPPTDISAEIPKLPAHPHAEWCQLTLRWWRTVWQSPMRHEYTEADIHGLWMMAMIVNDFWLAETQTARQSAAAEMRLQSTRFGLSPIDRSRLRWEIEKSDEAASKGDKRRAAVPAPPVPQGVDPRFRRPAG